MRIVFQRTQNSAVHVQKECVGQSSFGATLLVCIEKGDTEAVLKKAASKILAARVFNDDNEKMNLNIQQVQGSILAVSQFTLSWRGDKGNRPSFDLSMPPNEAEQLFNQFCELLREHVPVEKGRFGASMNVSLTNLGPVTFIFEF